MKKDSSLKISLLATLGSGLEYYDFIIYGLMAEYLSNIFFSPNVEYSQLIQTFAVFSVGYFARPIGGVMNGMISDTYGRKNTFIVIMIIMAISTLGIGLLPSYSQIGNASSIFLLILRVLQGISFGAELPCAITIIKEYSKDRNLSMLLSIMLSGTTIGSVIGIVIVTIMSNILTEDQIIEGYWRVPFIIGGTLAIITLYMRKNISETPEFLEYRSRLKSNSVFTPISRLFLQYFIKILVGFGITFFLSTVVIINIYFPVYLTRYFGYKMPDIYNSMTISAIFSIIFILFFGRVADYISKKKLLLFSLFSFALLIFFSFVLGYLSYIGITIFLILYQLHVAAYFTSYLPVLSKLFNTEVRSTAIGLIYNMSFCLSSLVLNLAVILIEKFNSPVLLTIFFYIAISISGISLSFLLFNNTLTVAA